MSRYFVLKTMTRSTVLPPFNKVGLLDFPAQGWHLLSAADVRSPHPYSSQMTQHVLVS